MHQSITTPFITSQKEGGLKTVGKESFYCTHNPLQRKEGRKKKRKAKILIIPCYNIHIFKSHNSPNHLHTR